MANKITNGTFASNLNGWSNIGDYNFEPAGGTAHTESSPTDSGAYRAILAQSFSITGTVVSATIHVKTIWEASNDSTDGEANFIVRLVKPDDTTVQLATADHTGTSGNADICNNLDIAAHLTQIGTYRLELEATVQSGWHVVIDEPVYTQSWAEYDDVDVLVVEKFTKTVTEKLGGGESFPRDVLKTILEKVGLTESLSHVGGTTGVTTTMLSREGMYLLESLGLLIMKVILEKVGLLESLARTYSYCHHDIEPGILGFSEWCQAKVTRGNVSYLVDISTPPTAWEDVPAHETDWEAS